MNQYRNKYLQGCVIGLGFLFTQLTFSLYTPALPKLALSFAVNTQDILATMTYLLLGYGIGQLFWGTISDQYGRQKITIIALAFYTVAGIMVSLSSNLFIFSLFQSLMGFSVAAMTSVGNAILRDVYGNKNAAKVISRIGVAMAAGTVIAPMIGSHLLQWFNWQGIFLFLTGLSIILVLGMSWLGETHPTKNRVHLQRGGLVAIYKMKLLESRFIAYIITLGLVFGCFISFISVAPLIFTHFFAMNIRTFGWLFLISSCSYIASTIIFSQFVQRVHPARFVMLGTMLSLFGTFGFCLVSYVQAQHVWIVCLVTAIMMSGFGFVIPAAKAGAMTIFQYHHGSTASLMKFFQTLLGVIITAIGSHLYNAETFFNITVFYLGILATSAALFAGLYFWRIRGDELSRLKTAESV